MSIADIKVLLQDKLIKKIMKNSGIIFLGNSLASGISIVSFTIMANQLGPQLLAVLVLAQTYALIVNDLFNIQTWESMVKFGSLKMENGSLANVIKTNLLLDAVSAIIAFVFALLFVYPVADLLGWESSSINLIALYSFSILFNITTFTIGIPRLFDKFLFIAKVQVVIAAIKLGAVLWAMFYSNTLESFILIYLICDILVNFILIIYSLTLLSKNIGPDWWKSKLNIEKNQVVFIWWTNLRTIVRIPVRHFDMIVISSVLSMKMVGIYKVYKEVAGFMNRIGEPINQAIFPEFAKLIAGNDVQQSVKIAKRTILLMTVVGSGVGLVFLLSSKFLVGTFFGSEYLEDIYALYALLVLFSINFSIVPINSLFIAAGFAKFSFYIVVFTNTVYLASAFYFGSMVGIYGVILAFFIQMLLNQGLKVFFLKKYSSDWSTNMR